MNLDCGFTLDDPALTIPWESTEPDLQALIGSRLRCVTGGYWTARVEVLGGLRCNLGFHFAKAHGRLEGLEFFRDSYADPKGSFDEFQTYFERAFGKPTESRPGTEGLPAHRWIVSGVEIKHHVFDRFGPEEHMRVRRLSGRAK